MNILLVLFLFPNMLCSSEHNLIEQRDTLNKTHKTALQEFLRLKCPLNIECQWGDRIFKPEWFNTCTHLTQIMNQTHIQIQLLNEKIYQESLKNHE